MASPWVQRLVGKEGEENIHIQASTLSNVFPLSCFRLSFSYGWLWLGRTEAGAGAGSAEAGAAEGWGDHDAQASVPLLSSHQLEPQPLSQP